MTIKAKVLQGTYGKQIKHNTQWYNIGSKDGNKVTVGKIYEFELVEKEHGGATRFFANLVVEKPSTVSINLTKADLEKFLKDLQKIIDAVLKPKKKQDVDDVPDEDDERVPWEQTDMAQGREEDLTL